jgi:hypothetical protein
VARRDVLLQAGLLNGAMISATVPDERMFRDAWWQGGQKRKTAITQLNRLRLVRS